MEPTLEQLQEELQKLNWIDPDLQCSIGLRMNAGKESDSGLFVTGWLLDPRAFTPLMANWRKVEGGRTFQCVIFDDPGLCEKLLESFHAQDGKYEELVDWK